MKLIEPIRDASRRLVRELGLLQGRSDCAGVTYAQGHVLLELEGAEPLSVADLADRLALDISTASRTLGRLQDMEYVSIDEDLEDRRRKYAALTPLGRKKLEDIHTTANTQVRGALKRLKPAERRKVEEGLRLYSAALGKDRTARELEIRPIRTTDQQALRDIIVTVSKEYGTDGEGGPTADPELEHLYETYAHAGAAYWVATRRGRVLGGGGINALRGAAAGICELQKMYLLPEARGVGAGRKLLEHCFASARKAGYKQCYIETTQCMKGARRLYEKAGAIPAEESLGDTGHHQCECRYVKVLDEA